MSMLVIACLVIMLGVLLLMRMPVAFIFLLVSTIGIAEIRGLDSALGLLGSRLYNIGSTYSLTVLPFFILMGHLAYESGITEELYVAARAWLGRLKGGLVLATTMANAAFAAACGETMAATAVFGKVAIPEMLRYGVNRKLAAGSVATAGTLAAMIPPSLSIIVFAILAHLSVARLLIAGILPGLLTAVCYGIMVYLRVLKNPSLAPRLPDVTWRERGRAIKGTWGIFSLVVLVIGGLFAGFFTPTEAGAVGAGGAFILLLVRKGRTSPKSIREAFLGSARTTSVVCIVLVGAMLFASFLALSGASAAISHYVISLDLPPYVLVGGFMVILIALGCIVDPLSMMFLTVPIIVPPLIEMGINPIWLGILVVKTNEIGMITPPLGLNAYMLKNVVPDFSMGEIFGGIWWFLQVEIVTMIILMFFPQISLWLPGVMFGG
ncbi:MAG: TRAP transporter large permease [Desulfobacteraceae bacterium]|nr:TRAP transporter large permease [Desulfobacteraceae bacterium]